jgi:hypothetical protein
MLGPVPLSERNGVELDGEIRNSKGKDVTVSASPSPLLQIFLGNVSVRSGRDDRLPAGVDYLFIFAVSVTLITLYLWKNDRELLKLFTVA